MNTQEELEQIRAFYRSWEDCEVVMTSSIIRDIMSDINTLLTLGQLDGIEKVIKALEQTKVVPITYGGWDSTDKSHNLYYCKGRDECITAARSVLSDLSKDNK